MTLRRLAIPGAVLALGITLTAQTPFKAGTRTVAVYATVTDEEGRLVPDLGRADFEVDDNNKRQDLSVFANDIQPITVAVMLDRSGSMAKNFDLVEQAAEEFVGALLPSDKARIGSFSNRIDLEPREFTSDRDEMLRILRSELQEVGPTPLWNAVNVAITALLHQQGRRVILVFTDGMDSPGNNNPNNNSLRDVMKRAEQEDVMVYAIGLLGQSGFGGAGGGFPGGYPDGRGGGFPGGRGGGFPGGRGGLGGGSRAQDKPDDGLPKIAAATGGGYFELSSTNDLASTFKRVAEELHHQYVLGSNPVLLDGKMHGLAVRTTRAGMAVRARKSYLAFAERSR